MLKAIGDFFCGIENFLIGITVFLGDVLEITTREEFLLPTLIALLAMSIKLFVNKKVCVLDLKKCFIELPCEILVLSIGFVISDVSNMGAGQKSYIDLFTVLILMVIDAAVIAFLEEKVANLKKLHMVVLILTYGLAFLAYVISIRAISNGGGVL